MKLRNIFIIYILTALSVDTYAQWTTQGVSNYIKGCETEYYNAEDIHKKLMNAIGEYEEKYGNLPYFDRPRNDSHDKYGKMLTEANRKFEECKKLKGQTANSTNVSKQPDTPEQQTDYKRQQNAQVLGALATGIADALADGNRQRWDQMAGSRDKVDHLNNAQYTNQPRDEQGIMGDAKANNRGSLNDGPGTETDEDDDNLVKKEVERGIETLFDKEIGDKIGLVGKDLAEGINKWKGYWDIGHKLTDGTVSPDDLQDLFPISDNKVVKEFQDAGRDGSIGNAKGKIGALDQLSQNMDSDGTPSVSAKQMSDYENLMHPGSYISSLQSVRGEKLSNSLKSNNPFNSQNPDLIKWAYAAGVTTIIGASTAPLWVPVVIGAWLAF